MYRLLFIGVDVLLSAVLVVPLLLILFKTYFKSTDQMKKILVLFFALSVSAVFSAAGIPSIRYITADFDLHLLPFVDIFNSPAAYVKNSLLNIVLFMPSGCLAALLWKKYRGWKSAALFGLGLSLAIEIMQLFNYRLTDIDDLITNTAGAVLGCVLAQVILKRVPALVGKEEEEEAGGQLPQLAILITLVFLVMFLVEPFLSDVIWGSFG